MSSPAFSKKLAWEAGALWGQGLTNPGLISVQSAQVPEGWVSIGGYGVGAWPMLSGAYWSMKVSYSRSSSLRSKINRPNTTTNSREMAKP